MNDMTVRLIARHPTLDNYKFVFGAMNYPVAVLNSFLAGVACTILQMASCCLSSYAFVRLRFPGSRFFFLLAVFTLVVPPETYMVAMYSQFQQLGLLNTFWPLFIKAFFSTGIRNGLYIFLMTQFFRNVPIELEEAAHVDGAGPLRIFCSVVLPNSVPILVTVAVFSFVWQWNDVFFSGMLAQGIDFVSTNLYNINVKISVVTGQYTDDHAYLSILKNAASVLTVAPLLLLFLAAQKFFVENMERSGIVG